MTQASGKKAWILKRYEGFFQWNEGSQIKSNLWSLLGMPDELEGGRTRSVITREDEGEQGDLL